MEPIPVVLTPAQQHLLATLSRKTGKPIPVLVDEALAVWQAHAQRRQEAHAPAQEEDVPPVKPARTPFWHKALEASQRIPEAEVERLPSDLAAQVDHYISGTPKR